MKVLADGCFDPLHIGHVRYLAAAAAFGHPLVVNIASDDVIREKGRQPFQTRVERAHTIHVLDMVDYVRTWDSLAEAVRFEWPRYLVKGSEWRGKLPDGVLQACQEAGTEIRYVDTHERRSTERLHDTRSV